MTPEELTKTTELINRALDSGSEPDAVQITLTVGAGRAGHSETTGLIKEIKKERDSASVAAEIPVATTEPEAESESEIEVSPEIRSQIEQLAERNVPLARIVKAVQTFGGVEWADAVYMVNAVVHPGNPNLEVPPMDDTDTHFCKGTIKAFQINGKEVWVDRNGVDDATGKQYRLAPEQVAEFDQIDRQEKLKEYNNLVEQSENGAERADNPYPVEAWGETPYLEFARLCRGLGKDQNYIPLEYFINGSMTVVGAVCGNRIVPEFNQKLQARFITLLLSEVGGIGKNTVLEWAKEPFEGSSLIYTHGIPMYKNIGCYVGDFGSARGMLEKFMLYPRVLQEYGELSTAIEKFNIAGSGQSFRDQILNLADSQVPNWSTIKGMRISSDVPKEISNSLIGGTTNDRFEEMMMQSNWETLIQRMNIIPTSETRTVFKLVVPDFSKMKEMFIPRISLLEAFRFVWSLSGEAEQIAIEWHEQLQSKTDSVQEDVGRIQVYLFRILGHMAFWTAPLPAFDTDTDKMFGPNMIYIPNGQTRDRIWRYEVGPELMRKAIKVAEYQIIARRETMPVRGTTIYGQIENLIKKWAFKQKSMQWSDLKRRSHIDRFGHKACHESLMNLQASGVIAVRSNPEDPADQRDWIVVWVGSKGHQRKWEERRGGARKGAGRKPPVN